jgi:hypothetical protein
LNTKIREKKYQMEILADNRRRKTGKTYLPGMEPTHVCADGVEHQAGATFPLKTEEQEYRQH